MSRTPTPPAARAALVLLFAAGLAGCDSPAVTPAPAIGGGGGAAGGPAAGGAGASRDGGLALPEHHLLRLELTPANDVLEVDRGQTATRAFTVTLTRGDGSTEDVTAKATLAADNPAAGALAGAVFRSAAMTTNNVAFTRIDARYEEGGESLHTRANLTVVWLRTSGDSQDFFFTLPYQAPPQGKPLTFTTYIQSIDVFLAIDATSSMGAPIANLRASLQDSIIPAVKRLAPRDAWFGVGAIEDFPVAPYGVANGHPGAVDDQPFILITPMTADVAAAQAGVTGLLRQDLLPTLESPRGFGSDMPEAHLEALYQVATGAGNLHAGVVDVPAHSGKGKGGVEFRAGAQPIVVTVSDVPSHTKGEADDLCKTNYAGPVADAAHTRAQTIDALKALCAKVIGVATLWPDAFYKDPRCTPTVDMARLAQATGALVPPEAWDVPGRPAGCPAGRCCTAENGAGEAPDADGRCPLVFRNDIKGNGLGVQVISGISQLARFGAFDLVATTAGDPLPGGGTTAGFITGVIPADATTPPAPPVVKAPVIRGGTFTGVAPGTVVRFTISARNDVVMEKVEPQVFHARIKISAGGCADLDERDVIILVPPARPVVE
jgi:hypothetical protein